MKSGMNFIARNLVVAAFLFAGFACSDDDKTKETGSANIVITDAPVDNAEVEGVFITVAEIKIDGKTFEGFETKQTFNLMAYQNGDVRLLGLGDVEVGSYSKVELILDYSSDANGNSPGCFVQTTNGKINLASGNETQGTVVANGNFEIYKDMTTDLVIDFNLRKAVKEGSSAQQRYVFVSETGLNSAVRLVNKENAGEIAGNFDGSIASSERVVVYAYKKGEFDSTVESNPNNHGILFAKSQNNAKVASNGEYTLAFLNEGDYELHFARFKENAEGKVEFETMLEVEAVSQVFLNNIAVNAGAKTTVNIKLLGVLGL
jgi:hypothetical protein